jgi:hypothetical protein
MPARGGQRLGRGQFQPVRGGPEAGGGGIDIGTDVGGGAGAGRIGIGQTAVRVGADGDAGALQMAGTLDQHLRMADHRLPLGRRAGARRWLPRAVSSMPTEPHRASEAGSILLAMVS